MKRTMLTGTAVLLSMACQDATSPHAGPPALAGDADLSQAGTNAVSHLFAVVDLNGWLINGSNVTGVTKLGPGQYEVTFNTDVSACAYVATTSNAYSQAIQAFTAAGHLNGNGVYVETKNQGGGLTDGPFNLVATCGASGLRYAVVGYNADLVRATPGTTMSFLGGGRYTISFSAAVGGCAFLASVGDPANALVFSPSAVYVASGSNNKTVYIETKNPGGGLQDGVPFHLILVCPGITKTRFAVIQASGGTQRASNATTTSRPATGTYEMATNRALNSCATIATRGSVGTGVPFNPGTVEILPGSSSSAVDVQVRQLLFFGGNPWNLSIHVASVC